MSRINQVPRGLQKLLGSQSFGDNPSNLVQDVQGQVALLDLFAADKLTFERTTNSAAGRGIVDNITVPSGELWMVHTVSCLLNGAAAADRYGISIRLDGLPGMQAGIGLSMPIARADFTAAAIGDLLSCFQSFDAGHLILQGGNRVTAWFDVHPAGTDSLDLMVWYAKL